MMGLLWAGESPRRGLCRELDLNFAADQVEPILIPVTLGTPDSSKSKAEGFGQGLFSSIYFGLTGQKSDKYFTSKHFHLRNPLSYSKFLDGKLTQSLKLTHFCGFV